MLSMAVLIGVGGGYGAVVFRWMIAVAGRLAFGELEPWFSRAAGGAAVIGVLVVGGILCTEITRRFAPEARGHGVPEVMAAVALKGGIIRPRVIAIKSIASATCIGFGGSCGREGPIVQIGATIASLCGQFLRAPAQVVRTLVACGAAAGISATFNAPIGGVFFASEVILGDFAPRSFAAIVVASVVAAVIGRASFGSAPSFTATEFYLVSPGELVLYALLGVLAAFWAAGFVKLLYWFEDRFEQLRWPAWAKAAIGFGLVGAIGLRFPQIFGVGYNAVQAVLDAHVAAPHALMLAVLKPLATSLTLAAGGSGGVFAPSLFTGAMLGDAFGRVVHDLFPAWTATSGAYGLVGMAALFAAASEAPITAIMIVFEMSDDYTIILPLMICAVIATIIGRWLIRGTIYELKLVRRGIDWTRAKSPKLLEQLTVASVERMAPVEADAGERLASIAKRLEAHDELVVPVLKDRRLIGTITASHLAAELLRNPQATAASAAKPPGATLSPDDTLERAATLMANAETPLLPVCDPESGDMRGIVTRRDVLDAYRSARRV